MKASTNFQEVRLEADNFFGVHSASQNLSWLPAVSMETSTKIQEVGKEKFLVEHLVTTRHKKSNNLTCK